MCVSERVCICLCIHFVPVRVCVCLCVHVYVCVTTAEESDTDLDNWWNYCIDGRFFDLITCEADYMYTAAALNEVRRGGIPGQNQISFLTDDSFVTKMTAANKSSLLAI